VYNKLKCSGPSADMLCGHPPDLPTFWAENWHTGYSCLGERSQFWFHSDL